MKTSAQEEEEEEEEAKEAGAAQGPRLLGLC